MAREQADSNEQKADECYVRNSSFLSRDIEAQKAKESLKRVVSPPGKESLTKMEKLESVTPPKSVSPPKNVPPPIKIDMQPKDSPISKGVTSPPFKRDSPLLKKEPPLMTSPPISVGEPSPILKKDNSSIPKREVIISPTLKLKRNDSKPENNAIPKMTRDAIDVKEFRKDIKDDHIKENKLQEPSNYDDDKNIENGGKTNIDNADSETKNNDNAIIPEESNGVGDKIRKFEKAAEDASASVGKLSRPGSVRGRSRSDRLGSDSKEEFPPPATPFKDNVFFELSAHNDKNTSTEQQQGNQTTLERQQSLTRTSVKLLKWQRSESNSIDTEKTIQKPEPQKIIKPEFKPMPSPVDLTIRSPSLGGKIPEQFPSQGTAFRNVASPDTSRTREIHKINEEVNTQNNFKTCKFKNKEKYNVNKGSSSYFTRGSEEIWMVKKKDIEEIEERVLDSFRRAGGNVCMRSESMRPSSDSGQGATFSHSTMGRKRQMYARSESLDPQWAGTRAQTLKRQSSVACTCGHDKKTRAKSAGAETNPRPRSRSHGDDNNQCHVLDKYETLV